MPTRLMTTRMLRTVTLSTVALMAACFLSSAFAMTLFDFDSADAVSGWFSVDDRVMGGVSVSQMRYAGDGVARFSGDMSLENNGGFASVRFTGQDFTGEFATVSFPNESCPYFLQSVVCRPRRMDHREVAV